MTTEREDALRKEIFSILRKDDRRNEVLATLEENCSAIYMTLVSIISSVALALLGAQVLDPGSKLDVIPTATTFLMIVLIWEECKVATTAFFWVTNLIDSFLPFVFGAYQIGLIYTMSSPADAPEENRLTNWCWTFAILFLSGMFWYWYTHGMAQKEKKNEDLLKTVKLFRWLNPVVCLIYAILFAILALASKELLEPSTVSVLSLTLVSLFFVKSSVFWNRVVRFAKNGED